MGHSQVVRLWGQKRFYRGTIFVTMCLKQIFLDTTELGGTKNWGSLSPVATLEMFIT